MPELEHAAKGGPVMIPIFALAGAALLVALLKWLQMVFVSTPSRGRIAALLDAGARKDKKKMHEKVEAIATVRRRPMRDWGRRVTCPSPPNARSCRLVLMNPGQTTMT